MLKNNFILIIILATISSCSIFNNNKDEIIEKDIFIEVLKDIHLTDASLETQSSIKDTIILNLCYDNVLKKHNVSRLQFKNTVKYYSSKPKEYNKIYEQILEQLSKKEKELQNERKLNNKDRETLKERE